MLTAQAYSNLKHDYIWKIGYGDTVTAIDFHEVPPLLNKEVRTIDTDYTNAAISDSTGNFQFYTNGLRIEGYNNQLLMGGDTMVYDSSIQAIFNLFLTGGRLTQGALALPIPNSGNKYILMYEYVYWDGTDMTGDNVKVSDLLYSIIDMDANEGLGAVIEANFPLLSDFLDAGKLTACRHANGRDWWIIVSQDNTTKKFRFLLTPNGISEMPPQYIGEPQEAGVGQAFYTPDGTKLVISNTPTWESGRIQVFDFNRCDGLLSNPRAFDFLVVMGIAISPNSLYLYAHNGDTLYQYDLSGDDIESSKILISIYDGYQYLDFFPTAFGQFQLAPDGKIYLRSTGGTPYYHVINQPSEAGLACNFVQRGMELPTSNGSIPNFPYYRLGPIDGSSCDTLGLNADTLSSIVVPPQSLQPTDALRVYPNPATDYFWVQFASPQQGATFSLTNTLGEVVLQRDLQPLVSTVWMRDLPAGVYVYTIEQAGSVLQSGKVVKY